MSRETMELATRALELLSAGEFSALIDVTDPEVEWHSFFAELSEGGVYRGHEGMRRYADDLTDAWDIVRTDIDDQLAIGDVAVLVGRIHYRGKESGVETETEAGWVLKVRNGKVTYFRAFREPERALGRLGLRTDTAD